MKANIDITTNTVALFAAVETMNEKKLRELAHAINAPVKKYKGATVLAVVDRLRELKAAATVQIVTK